MYKQLTTQTLDIGIQQENEVSQQIKTTIA